MARCVEQGVRVEVLGRRDRLPARVRDAIEAAERTTAAGEVLRLRLAIDYSSRDAIVRAAACGPSSRTELTRHLDAGGDRPVPDVDLLIRAGGEQRLSDFLLWESAYAELYFTGVAWPDFDGVALAAAVAELGRRQRRFGGLESVAGPRRWRRERAREAAERRAARGGGAGRAGGRPRAGARSSGSERPAVGPGGVAVLWCCCAGGAIERRGRRGGWSAVPWVRRCAGAA
jgi:hypothetical protein